MNEKDSFRSDETICCEIKCRKRVSSWWRPLVQFLAVFVCLNMKWHCIVFFCLGGEGMPAVNPTSLILSGSLATNAWAFRIRCFHTVANKNKQDKLTSLSIILLIQVASTIHLLGNEWRGEIPKHQHASRHEEGSSMLCLLFLPLNTTGCLETKACFIYEVIWVEFDCSPDCSLQHRNKLFLMSSHTNRFNSLSQTSVHITPMYLYTKCNNGSLSFSVKNSPAVVQMVL